MLSIITAVKGNQKGFDLVCAEVQDISDNLLMGLEHIVIACSSTVVPPGLRGVTRVSIADSGKGLYAALNDGLRNSSRQYVMFWHTGDRVNLEFIRKVSDRLKTDASPIDLLIGTVEFINESGETVRVWDQTKPQSLIGNLWMPPHTGTVTSKKMFRLIGLYDENFKISGDFDWFIRLNRVGGTFVIEHYDTCACVMSLGGISTNRSPLRHLNHFCEDLRAIGWSLDILRLVVKYARIDR